MYRKFFSTNYSLMNLYQKNIIIQHPKHIFMFRLFSSQGPQTQAEPTKQKNVCIKKT